MVVGTVAMLSTSHITKDDARRLEQFGHDSPFVPLASKLEDGFLLFWASPQALQDAAKDIGLSNAFLKVCEFAFCYLGADYLMLRADMETVPYLETYDW